MYASPKQCMHATHHPFDDECLYSPSPSSWLINSDMALAGYPSGVGEDGRMLGFTES